MENGYSPEFSNQIQQKRREADRQDMAQGRGAIAGQGRVERDTPEIMMATQEVFAALEFLEGTIVRLEEHIMNSNMVVPIPQPATGERVLGSTSYGSAHAATLHGMALRQRDLAERLNVIRASLAF